MKYIKLFESHGYDKLKKDFVSLFYKKVCEYGKVEGRNYYDRGNYEIEFTEVNASYFFSIIIKDEIGEIILILKSSEFNDSIFYKTLIEYFDDSDFFEKKEKEIIDTSNRVNPATEDINKYKILGTPEEIEEDIKDLETRVLANKYNI